MRNRSSSRWHALPPLCRANVRLGAKGSSLYFAAKPGFLTPRLELPASHTLRPRRCRSCRGCNVSSWATWARARRRRGGASEPHSRRASWRGGLAAACAPPLGTRKSSTMADERKTPGLWRGIGNRHGRVETNEDNLALSHIFSRHGGGKAGELAGPSSVDSPRCSRLRSKNTYSRITDVRGRGGSGLPWILLVAPRRRCRCPCKSTSGAQISQRCPL